MNIVLNITDQVMLDLQCKVRPHVRQGFLGPWNKWFQFATIPGEERTIRAIEQWAIQTSNPTICTEDFCFHMHNSGSKHTIAKTDNGQ